MALWQPSFVLCLFLTLQSPLSPYVSEFSKFHVIVSAGEVHQHLLTTLFTPQPCKNSSQSFETQSTPLIQTSHTASHITMPVSHISSHSSTDSLPKYTSEPEAPPTPHLSIADPESSHVPKLSQTATSALAVAKGEIAAVPAFSFNSARRAVADKHLSLAAHMLSAYEMDIFGTQVEGYLAWKNRSSLKMRVYTGVAASVVTALVVGVIVHTALHN